MQISFFEEFPTKENLNKLKLVIWPTKLYLAAKSLEEFKLINRQIKNKKVKEIIYWPILEKKEGYWISPFSKRKALLRIFGEVEKESIPMMLDLELPTTKNPLLYFTQLFNFTRNKSLIKSFINNYQGKIYFAEYYPEGKFKENILKFFGLHYQHPKVKIIKMVYHSLHNFKEDFIRDELKKGKEEYKNNYLAAFGTIAVGINGKDPILSADQLEKDLQLAKDIGIKEVIIFRLGGLNKKYVDVLRKFS